MKPHFVIGDSVRLYRKSPTSNVKAGNVGVVDYIYQGDDCVKYIVYFPYLGYDQIIYQTSLARERNNYGCY